MKERERIRRVVDVISSGLVGLGQLLQEDQLQAPENLLPQLRDNCYSPFLEKPGVRRQDPPQVDEILSRMKYREGIL